MKYNKKTAIYSFLAGILCALLLELVWFYSIPMPLWLSKKIAISYYMNFPQTQKTKLEPYKIVL